MSFVNEFYEICEKLKKEATSQNERRLIVIITEKEFKEVFKILERFVTENTLIVSYEKVEKGFWIEFKDSQKILGMTFDNAIVDLRENIHPDDIGRIVDTIKGSGLIFFIIYDFEKTLDHIHNFKKNLVYYSDEPARSIFEKRFIDKLLSSKCVTIVDLDKKQILKVGSIVKEKIKKKVLIFPKSKIPKRLLKVCITQDQLNVLKSLEKFFFSKNRVFILK
ncbi:MAG: tRNA(Met) cytidine acetyltransferase TmcA domain-containing protein, partial [Candidatus Aenigmatarchaeota archaeon]